MIQPRPDAKQIDHATKQKIREHYDRIATDRARYRKINRYYYQQLFAQLKSIVQPGKKILEVGCADGFVLQKLKPDRGVGIDLSEAMIEAAKERAQRKQLPHLEFHQADIETNRITETFDYIILSDVVGNLLDIQIALENLQPACTGSTRVLIQYHSMLWDPALKTAERLRLKMPQPLHNWLAPTDIDHFLNLSNFECISFDRRMLLPKYVPLFSNLINRYIAPLPLINAFCLTNLFVIRRRPVETDQTYSTTILIPSRNERGNIRPAIDRIPDFGGEQEILFVDGHSTDGTPEEIKQVINDFPDKNIKLFTQPGKGKGDAVRHGFAKATKDVLMILDADLTVPPEDLPKFYDAIASGKGEFINGTRLVYPMENEAMRFLNILGNKFFSVVLSWLLNQPLKDTLCGTKVLLRTDYERIAAGRSYFGDFDPFGDFDLIFGAARLNMKISEVPIRYRDRTYGTTNISRFRHGWLLLKMTAVAFRKLKLT